MDDLLHEFLAEAGEHLDIVDRELARLRRDPGDQAVFRTILRLIHTIKGTCGFLGLSGLATLTHSAETLIEACRGRGAPTLDTVEAIGAAIDGMRRIIADTEALGREPAARGTVRQTLIRSGAPDLQASPSHLPGIRPSDRVSLPIGSGWARFPKMVRELGEDLGKSLDLVTTGADIEVDRRVLDLVRDPLTHLVRNAADHGIEPPDHRVGAGKTAHGTIRITAFREARDAVIAVQDDGAGLDFRAIRLRAADMRLAGEAELAAMRDDELAGFVFEPGFSTARGVSLVSGRGIGLDVVRTNVGLIGGDVRISTERGRGTTCRIRIPLALSARLESAPPPRPDPRAHASRALGTRP